jgi:hypothetical protein
VFNLHQSAHFQVSLFPWAAPQKHPNHGLHFLQKILFAALVYLYENNFVDVMDVMSQMKVFRIPAENDSPIVGDVIWNEPIFQPLCKKAFITTSIS